MLDVIEAPAVETTANTWHALEPHEALGRLGSDAEAGLTTAEVSRRRASYGPNALAEAPRTPLWRRFLAQFQNFVIYILIFATVVSFLLGDQIEAFVIAAIVILNAVLGLVQEGRAEKALDALKKLAAPDARVRRDGQTQMVRAADLVPGDLVLLEAGDFIPADVRLLETANMKVEEAALTGESVPVEKDADSQAKPDSSLGDRHNMAYMGTVLTYGRGKGLVIATGMQTEMGKIAGLLQETEQEETPLQKRLNGLGKTLSIGALAICGVVFVAGAIQALAAGEPVLDSLTESFIIAISLAIAAVPEGLPAVVTINLAIGMREMIRRNALIRRLPAVETLGGATAICSDKTGTLTQNQMTAVRLYAGGQLFHVTGEGYAPHGTFHLNGNQAPRDDVKQLLLGGLLASDARLEKNAGAPGGFRMVGDPTEGALVVAAAKAELWRDQAEDAYPRVAEIPFDADRKRMSTLHALPDGGYLVFVKGAPDLVVQLCDTVYEGGISAPLTGARRAEILGMNSQLASQALRVLGMAQRRLDHLPDTITPETVETNLEFLGLAALRDPARPEVKPAIGVARQAGIRTVMVTGDYPDTARAIADEIGLLRPGGTVMTGAQIENTPDAELAQRIDDIDVFARVSPHHKVRIVEAFRARNHVVAMTGDGVNDAPALKRASIGVAMGITGTDVSKEAADMILTDDNYASIVSAVEQGRVIYSNIRKFVYYLLTCNLAEIAIIFLGTILGWGAPLSAIQLLWLNLITDGAPALALGVEKGDPDTMKLPPRAVDEPMINYDMKVGMVVQTAAKTVATLAAFLIGRGDIAVPGIVASPALAHTMAFATLSVSELLRAYTSRSELKLLAEIGLFTNKWMQIAVGTSLVLLLAVMYVPFLQVAFDTTALSAWHWVVIMPLNLLPAVAAEITKLFLRRRYRQQERLIPA
ncbi:MAG: cation-translocating P-type ATPase [Anaerolineae bacterium]|nr:cation-translocating P-type ATPase [Anaerolineae bacterium]